MAKINIFTDSIITSFIFNQKLNQEIINVLENEEKHSKGVVKSNIGGFQTNTITNEIICRNLLNSSVKELNNYYQFKENSNFLLKNLWINKNNKGNYNLPHVHPDTHFSGVYYVDVPERENNLSFIRNDISNIFTGIAEYVKDSDFSSRYDIVPKKNMLILFPANLLHMVNPNKDDKSRISVSFNISIVHG